MMALDERSGDLSYYRSSSGDHECEFQISQQPMQYLRYFSKKDKNLIAVLEERSGDHQCH